jgi:hypothetical protein
MVNNFSRTASDHHLGFVFRPDQDDPACNDTKTLSPTTTFTCSVGYFRSNFSSFHLLRRTTTLFDTAIEWHITFYDKVTGDAIPVHFHTLRFCNNPIDPDYFQRVSTQHLHRHSPVIDTGFRFQPQLDDTARGIVNQKTSQFG